MDYAVLVYIWLVRNVVYARVNEMIVAQFGCAAVGGCRWRHVCAYEGAEAVCAALTRPWQLMHARGSSYGLCSARIYMVGA